MKDAVAEKPGMVTRTTASAAFWMVPGAEVMSSRDGPLPFGEWLEEQAQRTRVAITTCREIARLAMRIFVRAVSDAGGSGVHRDLMRAAWRRTMRL
jgi:hypothetical protein